MSVFLPLFLRNQEFRKSIHYGRRQKKKRKSRRRRRRRRIKKPDRDELLSHEKRDKGDIKRNSLANATVLNKWKSNHHHAQTEEEEEKKERDEEEKDDHSGKKVIALN